MIWVLEEYEQRLGPWSDIQKHMPYLRSATAAYDNPVVIELGTRTGQSTVSFLAGLHDGKGSLWSVDVNVAQVPQDWFSLPQWNFLWADDRSQQAQDWLPRCCDVLFIDTSHEYQHTLDELELYVPRVRKGGVVLMHDTQFFPPGGDYGEPRGEVAHALNDYCARHGLAWTNRPGCYGLGVLFP